MMVLTQQRAVTNLPHFEECLTTGALTNDKNCSAVSCAFANSLHFKSQQTSLRAGNCVSGITLVLVEFIAAHKKIVDLTLTALQSESSLR